MNLFLLRCRRANLWWLPRALRLLAVVGLAGIAPVQASTTVVWVSIDGLRGSDLLAAEAPFLQGLMREGAYSLQMDPGFPSLTFPAHVTQATGAGVAVHGIPANHFFDRQSGKRWSYPGDPGLLQAEPIWTTATRQGRRTAVFDWPLAQAQRGTDRAAYFNDRYVSGRGDRARLRTLLDPWQRDADPQPLRLLMGYLPSVDGAGHRHGPGSQAVLEAIARTDRLLARFVQDLQAPREARPPGAAASLVLMITSDHGMAPVSRMLDARALLGLSRDDDSRVLTSGSLAQLYLPEGLSAPQRERRLRAAEAAVGREPTARVWRRDALPDAHPTRSGDLLVSLAAGAAFGPAGSRLRGAHGYALEDSLDMAALLLLQRYPVPFGGVDLGRVDARQLHPTVARLLDIQPAATARATPLSLP